MADLEAKHFTIRESREHGKFLVASDFIAEEWLEHFKAGEELSLQARKSRVGANHKHFFGVLRVARDHLEAYQDDESLLDAVKISSGHTRPVMLPDGRIVFIPKSINWDTMPEDEFRRFKNRAFYVLTELLGTDCVELAEAEWKHKKELRSNNRRSY